MTITRSEKLSFVLRKTSFTIRERLAPERACSPLTLMRDIFLFLRFSDLVNSPLRGFFLVAWFLPLVAHNPEILYPCIKLFCVDKKFSLARLSSYRGLYRHRWYSNSQSF